MREGRGEALGLDRFGEVVECMDLEGLDRISVVCGDEDGERHVGGADFVQDLKAAVAGHLDIEKGEVEGVRLRKWQQLKGKSRFPYAF